MNATRFAASGLSGDRKVKFLKLISSSSASSLGEDCEGETLVSDGGVVSLESVDCVEDEADIAGAELRFCAVLHRCG